MHEQKKAAEHASASGHGHRRRGGALRVGGDGALASSQDAAGALGPSHLDRHDKTITIDRLVKRPRDLGCAGETPQAA
jgi:hypothetical protein